MCRGMQPQDGKKCSGVILCALFLWKCFHISVCTRSPKAAAYSICVWWSGLWWFASNTHCQRVKMIHWHYCHCCILYIYALSLEIPTLQDYLSWQLGLNGRYILRVGTYSCIVSFFFRQLSSNSQNYRRLNIPKGTWKGGSGLWQLVNT